MDKKKRTFVIALTYRCNAECKDCGTYSSPYDRNDISLAEAKRYIDEASSLNFSAVVFTGGEATLRWNDLLSCIAYANEKKLLTRLVTNAYWATSIENTYKKIKKLLDVGLDEINFSTGPEHTRFVSLDNVIHASVVSAALGMSPYVMVELTKDTTLKLDNILSRMQELTTNKSIHNKITFTYSPWMPVDPNVVEEYPDGYAVNKSNVFSKSGCESVGHHFVLQANGNIGACCGFGMRMTPELQIGSINESTGLSDAVNESENDLFKMCLNILGPEKILAWVSEFNEDIKWENRYAHKCQACMRLYHDPIVKRVILENINDLLPSVLSRHWLQEYFINNRISAPMFSDTMHNDIGAQSEIVTRNRTVIEFDEVKDLFQIQLMDLQILNNSPFNVV